MSWWDFWNPTPAPPLPPVTPPPVTGPAPCASPPLPGCRYAPAAPGSPPPVTPAPEAPAPLPGDQIEGGWGYDVRISSTTAGDTNVEVLTYTAGGAAVAKLLYVADIGKVIHASDGGRLRLTFAPDSEHYKFARGTIEASFSRTYWPAGTWRVDPA